MLRLCTGGDYTNNGEVHYHCDNTAEPYQAWTMVLDTSINISDSRDVYPGHSPLWTCTDNGYHESARQHWLDVSMLEVQRTLLTSTFGPFVKASVRCLHFSFCMYGLLNYSHRRTHSGLLLSLSAPVPMFLTSCVLPVTPILLDGTSAISTCSHPSHGPSTISYRPVRP